MATEQHSIGYEEGFQNGWNAAVDSLPAQQEPVADKHQALIDSLPSDVEDKMFEQIHYWARQSYASHQQSTRGQTITAADSSDNHIIWAALRWAKENAATPPAQPPAQQEPVAIHQVYLDFGWVDRDESEMSAYADPDIWRTRIVYTSPPAQPSKPLTDEQVWDAYMEISAEFDCNVIDLVEFARAIEAKLKEKNNGN